MKSLTLILLLTLGSCAPSKAPQTVDDDYVLIEFASKLEEDNQHKNNGPTDTKKPRD